MLLSKSYISGLQFRNISLKIAIITVLRNNNSFITIIISINNFSKATFSFI